MRLPNCITDNLTTEAPRHGGKKDKRSKQKVRQAFFASNFSLSTFCFPRSSFQCLCGLIILASSVAAQRVAIIAPETSTQTHEYASQLSDHLSRKLNVLDDDMSLTAFRSVKLESQFNLTTTQGKAIGEVIGCEYFLLVRSETLRRSSLVREDYYESFVTVFLVAARSGRLAYWDLKSFEADKPPESERLLFTSAETFALEIVKHLASSRKSGADHGKKPFEEVPSPGSPASKNFQPPMPYKRIRPEYTRRAYLYDVRATVDVLVDIDQNGAVKSVEIERWGGFGLDESVIETVHKMNWRPATRNGKTLPMRVLLRYNFTKIEKE